MKREICYSFTVPGAPKGKARPRVTRTGHAFTPGTTAVYENLVKTVFLQEYPDTVPFSGPVFAAVNAYFPIPKSWSRKNKALAELGEIYPMGKPDFDNILKIILDALNGIAFTDDAHVVKIKKDSGKYYSIRPRVEVELYYEVDDESN